MTPDEANDINTAVIIPFRDRGQDLRRAANLQVVLAWWWAQGVTPQIVDDGLEGDAQFNRHRAYNRAVSRNPDADVFLFTEADMLIRTDQIHKAIWLAYQDPGLVVPFTQYRYLSDNTTGFVRHLFDTTPVRDLAEFIQEGEVFSMETESVMDNGKSIGAINVVSRETLAITGGFTEATKGNWYDDNIIEEGFAFLTGEPTRHVDGPAVHLYHLPGWTGDHLSREDKVATQTNKSILLNMRDQIRAGNPTWVHSLLSHREA